MSARVVQIERRVASAVRPSQRVLETAAMFGLGVDERRWLTIVPRVEIPLPRGGVVFVTGPSGGGKSTILRLIQERGREQGWRSLGVDDLREAPDRPLVDAIERPLERVMSLLTLVGLGDAFVMLRRPRELSDGQRCRLRLAQLIDALERDEAASEGVVILADEFGALLDRLSASIIARNLARWVRRTPHTLVCASAHDDLLESLAPDVLIYKGLGEQIEVMTR